MGSAGGRETAGTSSSPARFGRWAAARPFLVDAAGALLLAVVLGLPSLWLLGAPGSELVTGGAPAARQPGTSIAVAAIVAAHVGVAWRRTRPVAAFAVVFVGVAALTAVSVWWFLPTTLLALVAVYSACAYGPRRSPTACGVVVALGTPAVTALGFAVADLGVGPAGWLVHAAVRLGPWLVAAWGLGMFRRVRTAYVASLEERARRAEAEREERARRAVLEERARIAREMHDIVAHALSIVVSQANGGRYAAAADPATRDVLTTIAGTGRQALADLRGLLAVLRDPDGDEPSSHPRPADVRVLVDRVGAAGVPVEVEGEALLDESRLSPAAANAAFRVVQEALTNVVKHAGDGARAHLRLAGDDDWLWITVRDDGAGTAPSGAGQGLVGMRERAAVVGGAVEAGPAPDGGFAVTARIPRSGGAG